MDGSLPNPQEDNGTVALGLWLEEEVNRRVLKIMEELLGLPYKTLQQHADNPSDARWALSDAIRENLSHDAHFRNWIYEAANTVTAHKSKGS